MMTERECQERIEKWAFVFTLIGISSALVWGKWRRRGA